MSETINPTTEAVLQFLNIPDLDLGTPLDPQVLEEPEPLRDLVERLLAGPLPSPEAKALAESLRGRLGEVDWAEAAAQMHTRLSITSHFFDPVEENIKAATRKAAPGP